MTKEGTEIAVGDTFECSDCGETLVRKTDHDKEVASGLSHDCWSQLPEDSEHLRLD